jgi:heme A synthase
LVAAAGAITALGDTLFPSGSLAEGLRADFAATAHFLVRLRVIHPVLAVAAALYTVLLIWQDVRAKRTKRSRFASAILGLVLVELMVGATNIALQAPVAVQLVHLLLADAVWIAMVLYTSEALQRTDPPSGKVAVLPVQRRDAAEAIPG